MSSSEAVGLEEGEVNGDVSHSQSGSGEAMTESDGGRADGGTKKGKQQETDDPELDALLDGTAYFTAEK